MGNAMTDTTKLDELRRALLELHKALLDAQRIRYERENGRVESGGASRWSSCSRTRLSNGWFRIPSA
jgi:hypothetical protein